MTKARTLGYFYALNHFAGTASGRRCSLMAKTSAKSPRFEDSLGELERIVAAIEDGQMPLQDALDAYQRGMTLLRQCHDTLSAAEQQIRTLDAAEAMAATADADVEES